MKIFHAKWQTREEISAEENAREFEMEIWYDYLNRNVELRTEALKKD